MKKFRPKIPKMRIFEKKSWKIAAASGDPPLNPVNLRRLELRSQTSTLLLSPTVVVCVKCVSSIEHTLLRKITEGTHSKCFCFGFSALSCLFFTSNSAVFVGGCAKMFLAPQRLVH